MRLDGCTAAQALGLAGSRSSGLMQTLIDGSWVKQLHAGWAAQAGITCAWLAAEGVTGPPEVVEGRFGVFHSLLHGDEATFRLERITAGLGDKWLLPSTTFKPWPNGVWNHASMEGTMTILEREGIQAEEIERIDCRVPPVCIPLVCEPREAKLNPRSPYHMKFSLPYSVAMLAVRRRVGVEDYTAEVLADPAVRGLAGRVHCHPDSTLRTETFPARVQLTARDGRVFSSDVPAQLGSPNHPMSVEQHRQKFRYNVRGSLGDQATERLLGELENAWEAPSVRELLRLAAGRSTVPA